MKHYFSKADFPNGVTPCVGVWIETDKGVDAIKEANVTPCVGVWIETVKTEQQSSKEIVTPCVGVWIETDGDGLTLNVTGVTPCVGVWIETKKKPTRRNRETSHPAWVCGLKPGYSD